jgi:2-keto-4-pentenoate hydratase/2-oxohepta-3-ene-1,7-dioic acid hydratase in catechol pathway
MKVCHFIHQGQDFWGAYQNGRVFPFPETENESGPDNETDLRLTKSVAAELVKFLPPMTPTKIVCVGRNYAEHAAELGNEVPKEPLLFLKAPSSLITEGESIRIPAQSAQVEHEGELAVVISRTCSRLSPTDDPSAYVFGYTCLNDVTARDLQRRDVQFTRAKSFDTFCPVGALIETELDTSDLRVVTRVNGVVKQDGRTSQMVFPVDDLIRYISNQMTLNSGDIIATGTPSGVSQLKPGDVCEIEIEGIGVLKNPVIG